MKFAPLFALFVLTLQLSGCSGVFTPTQTSPTAEQPATAEEIEQPISIRAYAARRFLKSADYERYSLENFALWRECGVVQGGKNTKKLARPGRIEGDEYFKADPNLLPAKRRVEKLTEREKVRIQRLAQKLLALDTKDASLPAPGPVNQLTKPGVIEISVALGSSRKTISTNVDAIADEKNEGVKPVRELFRSLRKLGPAICGGDSFYGM